MNRLLLRASVSPTVHQVVWLVDGEDFAVADPMPRRSIGQPLPGVHRFQIRLPLQAGRFARGSRGR